MSGQFFKTIIGKGSEVETLLRKFTQLTIQEERLVSATVLSLTNQVLGILGDQTEGTHGTLSRHGERTDLNNPFQMIPNPRLEELSGRCFLVLVTP